MGISLVVTLLARDTQANQARLVEYLSVFDPDKWRLAGKALGDLATPALAAEVQRQAAAIACANDFSTMILITALALPMLLLMRGPDRRARPPAQVAPVG